MPSIATNKGTESVLRELLEKEGYELTTPRSHGQTGPDIVAERGADKIFIEVIGYKSSPPARSKDFFESFFRAVSRLKDGARKCVIALPSQFGRGLGARARQYGEAWTRIGKAFPELELWLVDDQKHTYKPEGWNKCLLRH
jgi:hypothetical protein